MRHLLSLVTIVCLAGAASAQESSALINKALDEQVQLEIPNVRLTEAMEAITTQTGVRIKEDPVIWELLPWGRDTTVQAKLKNVTLREALRKMTNTFGLTFALRDEFVEIQPLPALRRLAQRASRDELLTLDYLSSHPANLSVDRPTIKQLLEAVDEKLAAEKDMGVAIENRLGEAFRQDRTVFVPRNASLMDALESLTKDTRATWYPWGKNILVVSKEDRMRRLLSKPVTIRTDERGIAVMDLLMELAKRTGVAFEFEPGVIQSVPAEARNVRGVFDNAPAQQVLDAVVGATGLIYEIKDDKIHVGPGPAVGGSGRRDPIIGMLKLDNGLEVLVPTSQVPEDLREYIKHKTQKELEKIREMMEDENFKPQTQPTTRPATEDRDL